MKQIVFAIALLVSTSSFAASFETYKLYNDANHVVTPNCDAFTSLEVNYKTMTATLENRVSGICDKFVAPNTRSYSLTNVDGRLVGTDGTFLIDQVQMADGKNQTVVFEKNTVSYAYLVASQEDQSGINN